MDLLNEATNCLWYSIVDNVDFDIKKSSLSICVHSIEGGKRENHIVRINSFNAIMFLNNSEVSLEERNYIEISSVFFDKIDLNTDDYWLKQFPIRFNTVIEMWDTVLLVNSSSITIDDEEFYLL